MRVDGSHFPHRCTRYGDGSVQLRRECPGCAYGRGHSNGMRAGWASFWQELRKLMNGDFRPLGEHGDFGVPE